MFDKNSFNDMIIENDVINFCEPMADRGSPFYVNWRPLTNDVFFMNKIADFTYFFAKERMGSIGAIRTFIGVPEGATKIGIIAQFKWAYHQTTYGPNIYSLPLGRSIPKEHGSVRDRYFVGVPKDETVVIEDATATGRMLLEFVKVLRAAEINVIATLTLTDRDERRNDGKTIAEELSTMNIKHFAMSHATELLPLVFAKKRPPDDIRRKVKDYYQLYGARQPQF